MERLLSNTKQDARANSLLFAESRVIIGAGRLVSSCHESNETKSSASDTSATALSKILILLAYYPSYIKKLREEMNHVFAEGTFNCQTANPLLEVSINEAMRLFPSELFDSQRVTPP